MRYRGRAWELLKPIVREGVPKNWPFYAGYRFNKIDPVRMHQLLGDLRAMYFALTWWRDLAYSETSGLGDLVPSDYMSPNVSPDLARSRTKQVLEILADYHVVRSYFWDCLRRAYPSTKGKEIEIIVGTDGDCYAVSACDLKNLNDEGFGFMVSISRR